MKTNKRSFIKIIILEIPGYLIFLAEEIPNILAIITIPPLLGIMLFLPHVTSYIALIDSALLLIYLLVRSRKYNKKKPLGLTWKAGLSLTFIISLFINIVFIAAAMTNIKISLSK